ncbi:CD225/dispanin family protein [Aequorivita capsosiphonis]|uniref:CD225/dispanin family protein n=1 Tax=Aequorivita capsosiphonis TaxID=487317 RepID=UPI0006842C7C|nr:CD225/dispanin family protein [Aequorivita capsosiphonis]
METPSNPPMGTPEPNQPMSPPPDNNLVWAILCTVLCCMPLGIVSIIKSTQVKELWLKGDTAGAQKAANDAKKWAIWGAVIGPVIYILFLVVYFLIFGLYALGSY